MHILMVCGVLNQYPLLRVLLSLLSVFDNRVEWWERKVDDLSHDLKSDHWLNTKYEKKKKTKKPFSILVRVMTKLVPSCYTQLSGPFRPREERSEAHW